MSEALEDSRQPSGFRMIAAAVVVSLMVFAVWKIIDYRTQPPPPPHPVGAAPARR